MLWFGSIVQINEKRMRKKTRGEMKNTGNTNWMLQTMNKREHG